MKYIYNGANATEGTEVVVDEKKEITIGQNYTINSNKTIALIFPQNMRVVVSTNCKASVSYNMFGVSSVNTDTTFLQQLLNGDDGGTTTFAGDKLLALPALSGLVIANNSADDILVRFSYEH